MRATCGCGGGGWRRRGKAAAAGGLPLDELCCVVRGRGGINFCSLGGIGEVTPHNFLPLSSHDFVVILNSYVHKATKKVGYGFCTQNLMVYIPVSTQATSDVGTKWGQLYVTILKSYIS